MLLRIKSQIQQHQIEIMNRRESNISEYSILWLDSGFSPDLSDIGGTGTYDAQRAFIKQKPIKITYRDYRYFNDSIFLHDLRAASFHVCESLGQRDTNLVHNSFVKTFLQVIDKHAPLKSKNIRDNQAPFMTKELGKAIITRSRLRNIYNPNKTAENWELSRRQRNLCVTLRRKSIRNYFAGLSQRESVKSTAFWKTIRPLLNNKDGLNNETLSLFENGELVNKKLPYRRNIS